MQIYDIEKLAVAARIVADKCKEMGVESAPAQILQLRKSGEGKYEGAIISRIAADGSNFFTIASGWEQSEMRFSWSDIVKNQKKSDAIVAEYSASKA